MRQIIYPQKYFWGSADLTNFERVKQWLVFSRQWHLLDARWQDSDKLAAVIAKHLQGKNKPIYNPMADCGDHVIVYNCRHVAMKAFDWKHTEYYFHNRRPRGDAWFAAWDIHRHQPTRIVWMAVYSMLDKNLHRRRDIERLHLFPDEQVPSELMANVSSQIQQPMSCPRSLDDYSREERDKFPALFDFPETFTPEAGDAKESE